MIRGKIPALYKRYIRMVPGIRSYVLASTLVLVLGLAITVFSWYVDRQRIETEQNNRLDTHITAIRTDIVSRLSIYEQILRGANGLFKASENVTQAEWSSYVQQYDIEKTYPGVSGVGYIAYVPSASLDAYLTKMRAEAQPDFTVMPAGQRSDYAPITFSEPYNDNARRAIGFDVFSEPNHRAAANKATDSGQITVSEKLTLLSNTPNPAQGFVMYTAIYNKGTKPQTVEERRANLQGFIFAGYSASKFFDKTIDESKFSAYSAVEIFDGQSVHKDALLYQSKDFAEHAGRGISEAYTFKVFDRDWTIRFAGPIDNSASDKQGSNMILIGGITISVAIAGFLFLMMLTRARDIVYSKQKEAQQAKDDLLSLASHQLRTPATAVKQYLGMILEGYTGEVDKQQLPALQKAYSSNERQLETINQILYVAKADAGRLSIHRSQFDLNLLVDDIALDVSDTLEENGQSIKIERSSKRLRVNADESSLRMVIENLISNASKYSYKDSVITVKTSARKNEACIAVIDQGVGIKPEDFDKLFKKFSRIDNDLSLQVGGSGIGLYIDKVLIELHGGRIEVKSEVGKGSTFEIYIPRDIANLTDGGDNDSTV